MDHNHINWKALMHYLSGDCSTEEKEVIEQWIRMDPRNEEFILFLKNIWESSAEKKRDWDVDSAWGRFNQDYPLSDSDGLGEPDDSADSSDSDDLAGSDNSDISDSSADSSYTHMPGFRLPGKHEPPASSDSGKPETHAASDSDSSKTDDPFHSSEIRELSYREMKGIGSGKIESQNPQDSQSSDGSQHGKNTQDNQNPNGTPEESPGHSQPSPYLTPQKRKTVWKTWIAVAACITLIFSGLYFYETTPFVSSEDQPATYREIITENGQRTRVNLSDGSSVILNAGSRLTIPETFADQESREVTLTGEAFFETAHRPDQPFIVHTGRTQTEVLGTTFLVRSYPEDDQTEVVVTEGSVALYKPNQTEQQKVVISESQLGVWTAEGGNLYDLEDPSIYTGWTDGRLIFHHEPLESVIKKLKRWYDVDVKIEGENSELLRHELTAQFSDTQSMQEVFEAIALTMEIRYRSDGSTYIFTQ